MSEAGLRIFLLGRFSVEFGGAPVPQSAWKRRRPVELLTALALALWLKGQTREHFRSIRIWSGRASQHESDGDA